MAETFGRPSKYVLVKDSLCHPYKMTDKDKSRDHYRSHNFDLSNTAAKFTPHSDLPSPDLSIRPRSQAAKDLFKASKPRTRSLSTQRGKHRDNETSSTSPDPQSSESDTEGSPGIYRC